MTTTEPYPPAPGNPRPTRGPLRRSSTDRVGAGVAGGLGEYFAVDPVLFRVLFATAAFFGGAGLLGYLVAWAVIPEQGAERAPIDSWIDGLRARRAPFVLVAVAAIVLFWLVAFSWWAPGPSLPLMIIVILLVLLFGRRGYRRDWARWDTDTRAESDGPAAVSNELPAPTDRTAPPWVRDLRHWAGESRAASRARRRRALPLRIAGLALLAVTLTVLGLVDAAHGIAIPTYLWFSLAILGATLLVGLVSRRTPWSLAGLLVPVVIALIGLGGTHASLRDGIGQKEWRPTAAATHADYRLAFGQGILDLRSLPAATKPETIDVTVASGQVRVIVPAAMNVSLRAEVHFGNLTVDGNDYDDIDGFRSRGVNLDRTVPPNAGASGAPILVRVHLADGNVSLTHR